MTPPAEHFRSRSPFSCAWPALLLALLLLLPFLKTPFTIDDPIYLREAEHALSDFLHPQAFDIVWSTDLRLRASMILPGGIAVPYLLIPTALAGYTEWAGHLTQLIFLLGAILAIARMALLLGLGHSRARLAALLLATCPAVLGMAGTVMPDIAAMLFSILGMERVLSWRESRRWHQALAAGAWLALAALTRSHTILILAPAFIVLLDGIRGEEIRASFRIFPARFAPVLLAPVIFFLVSAITSDPESHGENILVTLLRMSRHWSVPAENACAFLAHWVLVIPLTIPWLILRFFRIPRTLLPAALSVAAMLYFIAGWIAFPATATLVVLADILWDALQRRDRVQAALWVWLLIATPVILYVQLPSKYLLPSVPAAVILIVRLVREDRRAAGRRILYCFAAFGAVSGLLILLGIRTLAVTQRRAVADLIEPRVKMQRRVWFAGHWGFQWYAEHGGAMPVTLGAPYPQKGDIVVISPIDFPLFLRNPPAHHILPNPPGIAEGWGSVMDIDSGAGFFSNRYGYLPWAPQRSAGNRFEVWEIE